MDKIRFIVEVNGWQIPVNVNDEGEVFRAMGIKKSNGLPILPKSPNQSVYKPPSPEITTRDVEEFILNQPDYRHDTHSIAKFFDINVKAIYRNPEKMKDYDRIWTKASIVRKKIAKREKGVWEKERRGFKNAITVHWFKRDQDEQETLLENIGTAIVPSSMKNE